MMVGGVHRLRKQFIFSGAFDIITGRAAITPKKEGSTPAKIGVDGDGQLILDQGGGIDLWSFYFWIISGRYPRAFFVANQYGDWINFSAKAATAGWLINKYGINKWRAAKKIGKKAWLHQHMKPRPKFSAKPSSLKGFGTPFGSAGPTFFMGAPIIINAVLGTGADEWAFNLTDNRSEREKMDFIAM